VFRNSPILLTAEAAGFANNAWSAVSSGFEIQIDNSGAAPQGLPKHRTGVVYAVNYPGDPAPGPSLPPATPGDFARPQNALVLGWNHYKIQVKGDIFSINLNGADTPQYTTPILREAISRRLLRRSSAYSRTRITVSHGI
jgi:hypothetical protein